MSNLINNQINQTYDELEVGQVFRSGGRTITETDVVNYCTEAPFIQTLCPTLVLGPGSINQAHQPDEFLETRFIKPTRELISQVVHHFCWH